MTIAPALLYKHSSLAQSHYSSNSLLRSDANAYQVNGICARGFAEQTKPVNYVLCSFVLRTNLRIKENETLNKLAIRSKDK